MLTRGIAIISLQASKMNLWPSHEGERFMVTGMRHVLAFMLLLVLGCQHSSRAQESLAAVWRGKTITIVVGTSAGGGFDTYARLLSRHLGRHVPGQPTVTVTNMPGAASNSMSGYVANVAPKDGTYIGAPLSSQPLAPILEDATNLQYDPAKLHYIGSGADDFHLCVVRSDSAVKSFSDVLQHEIIMGGSSEISQTGYLPMLLNNVLGARFKIVYGYPGSREVVLAMEKKEVDGYCGASWSSLNSQFADLIKTKSIRLLVQESLRGSQELTQMGIPRAGDFARSDEQRKILNIVYSQELFGRPYFLAPGVPPERAKALDAAFAAAWRDPALLREAENANLPIAPIAGVEIRNILQEIYGSPPDLLAKARQAIRPKR